jgi:hypothetical protein
MYLNVKNLKNKGKNSVALYFKIYVYENPYHTYQLQAKGTTNEICPSARFSEYF